MATILGWFLYLSIALSIRLQSLSAKGLVLLNLQYFAKYFWNLLGFTENLVLK